MLRLGWFSTGRDEAARRLLSAIMEKRREGLLDISVEFVFSNWEPGEEPTHRDFADRERFFRLVRSYGIPLVTLSWKRYRSDLRERDIGLWRTEYGKELRRLLSAYDFDIGVLAGYMLWVDDETCRAFPLINLHPALPGGPKGTWQEVIWQLIREEADEQGAMIHLCTPDWDEGPPLTYCQFSLRTEAFEPLWRQMREKLKRRELEEIIREEGEGEPLFRRIRKEGERRELPLLAYTIKLFSEGRVHIREGNLYEGETPLDRPYDLTSEVDLALERGEFGE